MLTDIFPVICEVSDMLIASTVGSLVVVAVLVFLAIKLLTAPMKWIFKFLLHALIGLVILFVVNFVGGFFDLYPVPMTLPNYLIAGIFGIPGVIVLIVLNLFVF